MLRIFVSLIQMLMLFQVLRLEMDAQQRQILVLQESVLQLVSDSDSSDSNSMLERVEMLQDRWDALIQIMEVQGQRVRIIHSYYVKNRFTHVLLIMYCFNKCYNQIFFPCRYQMLVLNLTWSHHQEKQSLPCYQSSSGK